MHNIIISSGNRYAFQFDAEIFRYYFYFIQERMKIFRAKLEGKKAPWTDDPILNEYRFTNVYRATDRVSQFLINRVIPDGSIFSSRDTIFRVIVFKIFNRIDTWEYLERKFGRLSIANFDVSSISKSLSQRQKLKPIFNNAYMMTGSHSRYNHLTTKHEKWLTMVKNELIEEDRIEQLLQAKSLKEVFEKLNECSFLGDFLSYQYAIDLNYSEIFKFDENSFVKAGIGAVRGVKKCFPEIPNNKIDDAIRFTQSNFGELQARFGFTEFKGIQGHPPTLIDLQNCFCETDKYLRAKRPDLVIDNTRIKQKYRINEIHLPIRLPHYWGAQEMGGSCM